MRDGGSKRRTSDGAVEWCESPVAAPVPQSFCDASSACKCTLCYTVDIHRDESKKPSVEVEKLA